MSARKKPIQRGTRIGRLVAVELLQDSQSLAHQRWLFRCTCGNQVERATSVVTRPRTVPTCRACATARLRELCERRRRSC